MKNRGEQIFAIFLLAVFLMFFIVGTGYTRKARRLPIILGVPGVILAATILIRATISRPREGAAIGEKGSNTIRTDVGVVGKRKVLEMIGWVALMVGMIWVFGFLITIPVYVFLFLKARKEKWILSIAFAVSSWAFLYWIFVYVLNVILYPGILFK